MNKSVLALALVGVLALAGCSTTPAAKPAHKTTSTPAAVSIGEDAGVIAIRIKGCEDVRVGDIAGGAPALLSTATCMLYGHTINVNSWASGRDSNIEPVLAGDARETYYARGDSWTVTLGDDPILQYQFTNQADKLLQAAFAGHTAGPVNLSVEQNVARAAVASLGGEVYHYVP
ncbi:peptidase [Leifsonia xyli subsp. cynodontis DSM 46306]|uniref:DUF3558 domain-containing protein n=1 Tax=Leifsonia xyli subsp. cynodontis DSM 46306 TaxID=1389489 RepID=U3P9S5_LEIXC|nr:hypothetical protein [Leifsonia xyli]AGW42279.1 peptidase [Leifsonia xyli subsp. cynodontis DSM 46306]